MQITVQQPSQVRDSQLQRTKLVKTAHEIQKVGIHTLMPPEEEDHDQASQDAEPTKIRRNETDRGYSRTYPESTKVRRENSLLKQSEWFYAFCWKLTRTGSTKKKHSFTLYIILQKILM